MTASKQKEFDAVSLGIMWDRLVALTDEIVSTLVRSSFSKSRFPQRSKTRRKFT